MKQFSFFASTVLGQISHIKEEKAKTEEKMLLADLKLPENIEQDGSVISPTREFLCTLCNTYSQTQSSFLATGIKTRQKI